MADVKQPEGGSAVASDKGSHPTIEAVKAVTALLQVVVWPVLVVFVFLALRDPLTGLLNRTRRLEGKVAGMQFSISALEASA
jgi:hypothetical protein